MNSEMEFEIDLKDMLYRILVKWRVILRGALIIAFLVGGYRLVTGLIERFDSEKLEKAMNKYIIELNDYEATGERLNLQISNYRDDIEQQTIYNEKSIIMKIDPMEKWIGSFVLYIDANYQIDPSLSVQNTDPTLRMLMAYSGYLNSGELYTALLEEIEDIDEIRFLREILSRSTDTNASTITVTCVGATEAQVSGILNAVKQHLYEKYEAFQTSLGEHSIEILTESLYSTIDLDLDETQKNNILRINNYTNQIGELDLELEEWEKSPEPKAKYGTFYTIKQAVKYLIIGGVAGVVVMVGCLALGYIFSRNIKTDSDMAVMNVPVLGVIWRKITEKSENGFEHWFDKAILEKIGFDHWAIHTIGGRSWNIDEKTQDRLLVNSLSAILAQNELSTAYVVAAMDAEESHGVVNDLASVDKSNSFVFAGNVLEDPESMNKLSKTKDVILISKRYVTKVDDVLRTKALLAAAGKSILGAVILEDIE